ncbi:MAG: hypothetical protein KDE51_01220 [Anaerolineales bacterium]|nr:hypothetical protein [Anaerolineales bacterium]
MQERPTSSDGDGKNTAKNAPSGEQKVVLDRFWDGNGSKFGVKQVKFAVLCQNGFDKTQLIYYTFKYYTVSGYYE